MSTMRILSLNGADGIPMQNGKKAKKAKKNQQNTVISTRGSKNTFIFLSECTKRSKPSIYTMNMIKSTGSQRSTLKTQIFCPYLLPTMLGHDTPGAQSYLTF